MQVCEDWMKVREDRLNEHFSQSDFKLDQGEAAADNGGCPEGGGVSTIG